MPLIGIFTFFNMVSGLIALILGFNVFRYRQSGYQITLSLLFFSVLGTMKEKGSGIGLHICHNLVRANKGQMDIDSRLNRGTTITISLPVTIG